MPDLDLFGEKAERQWPKATSAKPERYAWHAPEMECIGEGKAKVPVRVPGDIKPDTGSGAAPTHQGPAPDR